MSAFTALKYFAASKIKQHPQIMVPVWDILPRIPMLLPHEKSYYGLRHIKSSPNRLFVDVGANNGLTALGVKKVMGKGYPILSIEANPCHEASLSRIQRYYDNYDYSLTALGSKSGKFTLYTPIYRGHKITALASADLEYVKTMVARDYGSEIAGKVLYREDRVQVVTLDSLGLDVSVLKIDVEGLDHEVLLGAQDTIDRCRPIILIEFTPGYSERSVAWLTNKGFSSMYVYDYKADCFERFNAARESDSWEHKALQVNIFCVHDDPESPQLNVGR